MRKTLIVSIIALSSLFVAFESQAQLKIGHINASELVAQMAGVKEADAALKEYASALEATIQEMYQEYQTKVTDFEKKKDLMNEAIREIKTKEIGDLENRINEFQQTANEKLSEKKEELYSPILKKAEEAIKKVAKENKYTYVLDTSMGSVLFADESKDITDLVKKELGIE